MSDSAHRSLCRAAQVTDHAAWSHTNSPTTKRWHSLSMVAMVARRCKCRVCILLTSFPCWLGPTTPGSNCCTHWATFWANRWPRFRPGFLVILLLQKPHSAMDAAIPQNSIESFKGSIVCIFMSSIMFWVSVHFPESKIKQDFVNLLTINENGKIHQKIRTQIKK